MCTLLVKESIIACDRCDQIDISLRDYEIFRTSTINMEFYGSTFDKRYFEIIGNCIWGN